VFDISFSELLLVALVALVVIGPKRLPEVARGAGRMLGRLRSFVTNVKQDFDREIHTHELSELRRLKEELEETKRTFQESSHRLLESVAHADTASATPAMPPPSPESSARRHPKKKHGKAKKKTRRARR